MPRVRKSRLDIPFSVLSQRCYRSLLRFCRSGCSLIRFLVVGGELSGGKNKLTQTTVDAADPYPSGMIFQYAADILGGEAVCLVVGEQRVVDLVITEQSVVLRTD